MDMFDMANVNIPLEGKRTVIIMGNGMSFFFADINQLYFRRFFPTLPFRQNTKTQITSCLRERNVL